MTIRSSNLIGSTLGVMTAAAATALAIIYVIETSLLRMM